MLLYIWYQQQQSPGKVTPNACHTHPPANPHCMQTFKSLNFTLSKLGSQRASDIFEKDSRSLRRKVIKLIEVNPKAGNCLRPTLVLTEENNKTSALDVDLTFTMEMKDVQQTKQNVTLP